MTRLVVPPWSIMDFEGFCNTSRPSGKGGCNMVTLSDLLSFCLVLIGFARLVIEITDRSKKK